MTTERPRSEANELPAQVDEAQRIENACRQVMSLRNRPLLVLYYPGPYGQMEEDDVQNCYQTFRTAGVDAAQPLAQLDVLIHTFGGDPVTAYRLAQLIRNFALDVTFLVPEYSYSAGTLLCFSGNRIMFGHNAGMGPIDITQEGVELASIDSFSVFAKDSEEMIRRMVKSDDGVRNLSVASDLLCKLVEEVGALKIGEYYRARTLTGHYAQELLDNYMLSGLPNRVGRRNRIIRRLLFELPSHNFHLDFHLCAGLGLAVEEMAVTESDMSKNIVTILNDLTQRDIICQNVTDDVKMPFITFYS